VQSASVTQVGGVGVAMGVAVAVGVSVDTGTLTVGVGVSVGVAVDAGAGVAVFIGVGVLESGVDPGHTTPSVIANGYAWQSNSSATALPPSRMHSPKLNDESIFPSHALDASNGHIGHHGGAAAHVATSASSCPSASRSRALVFASGHGPGLRPCRIASRHFSSRRARAKTYRTPAFAAARTQAMSALLVGHGTDGSPQSNGEPAGT
jgi:hypothetical protein